MNELARELLHFGLSEKEAAVYLAALEMGPSPVQDISHKAKVNRATTYVMIEALTNRGLMSTYVKGKKRFYAAETPDRLRTILRMQQKELEEKENELGEVLPLLLALYNAEGAKPQIRYLEGSEGLQTVRQTFNKLEGEFIQIVPYDDLKAFEEIMAQQSEHLKELAEQNASYRALLVMKDPKVENIPKALNGEARVIPADKFPIHSEITVRGNHILLYSFKSAILSVVIVSQEIADAIRALFDMAWLGTENYPSKKQ
ncbi:hypothetical protein KJ611_00860 [Patescibacteria group bacterium]|nr:hypothetical protein [Patescibacteria group bacterium]MBU1705756.1 hypothetical protein [Patescibacteria group bacterium]